MINEKFPMQSMFRLLGLQENSHHKYISGEQYTIKIANSKQF